MSSSHLSSQTFYLYNNSVPLVSHVATSSCASGTNWNGSVCQATTPPPSGTLTLSSSSCTIPSGTDHCNISLTWNITNPVGSSERKSTRLKYSHANTSYAVFCPITKSVHYSSQTFYLYNNSVPHRNHVPTSIHSFPTRRSSDLCQATTPPPSGTLTLSSSSCTIPSGTDHCNISLTWNITNPVGSSAVTTDYPAQNTVLATTSSGGPLTASVHYSSQTFYLYNNSVPLVSHVATSSCASGTSWNGSVCQATTPPPSGTLTLSSSSCTIPYVT